MRKKLELYKGATRKTLILDHKRQRQVHFGGLAFYYRDEIIPAMSALRTPCDELEKLTAESVWPFPEKGRITAV